MSERMTLVPKEAAKEANVSLPTIYEWCRIPSFPAIHVGRKIVIPTDAFRRWLEAQAGQGCIDGRAV